MLRHMHAASLVIFLRSRRQSNTFWTGWSPVCSEIVLLALMCW